MSLRVHALTRFAAQTVIMLGDVRAHKLVSSDVTARGVLMFTVTKVRCSWYLPGIGTA